MKIFAKKSSGQTIPLNVKPSYKIKVLKRLIEKVAYIPRGQQRLIFHDNLISECGSTVEDNNIESGSILTLIVLREDHEPLSVD